MFLDSGFVPRGLDHFCYLLWGMSALFLLCGTSMFFGALRDRSDDLFGTRDREREESQRLVIEQARKAAMEVEA